MHHLPRYEHYKDSGVVWLGVIPAHWELKPLTKYASRVDYRGKTPTKVDEGIFLVTTKNIKDGRIDYEISKEYVLQNEYDSIMLRGLPGLGDILFTMEAPLGMSAIVDRSDIAIAQRIIKFRFEKKEFDPVFVNYSIQAEYFQTHLQQEATGSTAQGIKASKLHKLKLITPLLAEQTAIAEFLDQKTAQIDRAIAQKETLIALLQERRQILIHQAVTRGLNSKAPMKDSGVTWLGQIPAHWEVKRAKYLFDEIDARSETGDEELLSVSHMTGVTPRSEKNVSMFQAEDYTGSKLCQKDDLIFNIMWAWMGALGVSDRTGIVSPSYAVYRPKQPGAFNAWYLENLLRDGNYVAEYNRVSTGLHSSRLRLYSHMFFRMEIGFPAREEQDEIERATKKKTTLIDDEIARTQGVIEKLKEYKATLINSAVTGKIKIPAQRNPEGM